MIAIGEAGEGHSFTSKAEGQIPFRHKGAALPLFTRVIYADQVSENIMSVAEAADNGFTIVFNKEGVKMYKAADCEVQGAPVLTGTRDARTRLFYLNFATPPPCVVQSASTRQEPVPTSSVGPGGKQVIENTRRVRALQNDEVAVPAHVSANLSKTYHEYKTDFDLWHPRLAHINPRMAKRALPDLKEWPAKSHCDAALKASFTSSATMVHDQERLICLGHLAST